MSRRRGPSTNHYPLHTTMSKEDFKEVLETARLRLFDNRIDIGGEYSAPVITTELDDGDTEEVIIHNPEGSEISVDIRSVLAVGESSGLLYLYDGVTDPSGSELELVNKNKYFDDDSKTKLYENPEYDDSGTQIFVTPFGEIGTGGSFGGGSGGKSISSPITTLAPSGSRLIQVQSTSDGNTVRYNIDIIEREPTNAELEQLE